MSLAMSEKNISMRHHGNVIDIIDISLFKESIFFTSATCVHISVTKWYFVGYLSDALCDL